MRPDIASFADTVRIHARLRPDDVAMWFDGRQTTYAELDRLSSKCANALIAAGVRPGERVGVLAKGSDDFFILWLGCAKARACLAPVNWRLAPPEIAFVLEDAQVRLMVVGADYAGVVEGLSAERPELHTLIQIEPGHVRWPSLRDWFATANDADPSLPCSPDDDVIQLYTSGTTGLPKGVQLTEKNYLAVFRSADADWGRFEAGSAVLVAMPLFHVAGANLGALSFLHGARAIVLREPDPSAILRVVEAHGVAHAFIVPALINMLLQHPQIDAADLSSLKHIYYGASPISEEVLRKAQKRFGCGLTQLYGLTETIGGGTNLPPEAHDPALGKLRSCGRPSAG